MGQDDGQSPGDNRRFDENEEEMIEATKKIDTLSPEDCRKHIEKNFSREKMTENYFAIYKKVLADQTSLESLAVH